MTGQPPLGHHAEVELTEGSFRALARSSPWRWRTLHFKRRSNDGTVEAWVRRPGELLVREVDGRDHYESGLPYVTSWLSTDPDSSGPEKRLPHQVAPPLRADGLVAERPSDFDVSYDDPMYNDYTWVAMLDPVELSHHTLVDEVRTARHHGREVWRARVRADEGYNPRCPCCVLLWSEIAARDSAEVDGVPFVPDRDVGYPDGFDVALDVQTGVLVSLEPVGGDRSDLGIDVQILEVDADVDGLFVGVG